MRFLFALLLFMVCVPVHAATMCVPDLSTCTSCSDFTYEGIEWSANCCGVYVRGFYVEDVVDNTTPSHEVMMKDVQLFGSGNNYRAICFMVSPFVAPYGVANDCIRYERHSKINCFNFVPSVAINGPEGVGCLEVGQFRCEK